LARGQVFGLEAALLAADHHEGQWLLVVLQLHEGAGDRLPGGVADDPLHIASVSGQHGLSGKQQGAGGDSGSQIPIDVSQRHLVSPCWDFASMLGEVMHAGRERQ
jgi:hypothetical protein